jgi:acyl-coenzyme A thioesterase PaaI-like protein
MKPAPVSARALQALLDKSRFIRHYGFRVVRATKAACTLELPHRPLLERPGGIINGPALMAAADCAMWLAIKTRLGIDEDALTSELNTAFLAPAKGEHVYCTAKILKFGRRRIYGVAECHGKTGGLFSHHTVTYVRPS